MITPKLEDVGVPPGRCRRTAGPGTIQAHQVKGVRRFAAELEGDSFSEMEVTENSQVYVAVTRIAQIVTRYVAVGAARPDAAGHGPGAVSDKRLRC